ncbi:uracil-DNA glycosylase [Thioalkalivibrio sp. ALE16]|uniref:uracil-DNA glycosylase n=1 Tax=Thioalkalivibrio sp. ALE16 TaxID=1158172 RepID=UPI0006855ED5|nr:uracil-DNA glycosylase [Thioalkalivibrio sp. ALE16]
MISRDCHLCRLRGQAEQVVNPDGAKGSILAIGEGPGADEDEHGVGFIGAAGQTLEREMYAAAGLTRQQWARANIVRCRPPGNRKPFADEIRSCSGWLDQTIDGMRPAVLLLVGESAGRHLGNSVIRRQESYLSQVHRLLHDVMAKEVAPGTSRIADLLPQYRGVPVVPMPHTSGLAWNRRYRPSGIEGPEKRIADLGRLALKIAVRVRSDLFESKHQ